MGAGGGGGYSLCGEAVCCVLRGCAVLGGCFLCGLGVC